MKSFLLGLAIMISINVLAQQSPVAFKTTKHSFGKVKQHVPATTEFEFTNNSGKNVIIETVTPSCGCTAPEYPKGAILNGKTAKIKVSYNAEALGTFSKTVTVKLFNVPEPIVLTIEGEVVTPASTAAKKPASKKA